MPKPLAKNAIDYLQRRYPSATVSFGELTVTVAPDGADELLVPEKFVAWHMIAQEPDAGVKHRAIAIHDLGISQTQVSAIAQEIKQVLSNLDKDITIERRYAANGTATGISSVEMPFGARIVIYTDQLCCPASDVIELFENQSIKIEIIEQSKLYNSAFISYGGSDEDAATKINDYLRAKGIKTWFFAADHLPGEKLHRMMHKYVNQYDRVILICSKKSLERNGVLNELEKVLEREAKEGGSSILIPITLDKYVYGDWAPERSDIAEQVRTRVISKVDVPINSDAKTCEQLDRLARALAR